MSGISISEAEFQAYVDQRLPDDRRGEAERYLAAHPEESQRLAAYRAQSEKLRAAFAPALDEPIPGRLAQALRPRGARLLRVAAAFALVALGGIIGWQLHGSIERQARDQTIARGAALAHATYSPEVRHAVEVGADQEAHLVAWLSKRLGGKIRAPNLEAVGYVLMGGRLLPGDDSDPGGVSPTAQFMYQNKQGTRVTLYVRTNLRDQDQTAFRYALEGKVGVFYWIDRSFGYALSSADIDRNELLIIANAAYAQLNP